MIRHHNENGSNSIWRTLNILQSIYSIFVKPTAEKLFKFLLSNCQCLIHNNSSEFKFCFVHTWPCVSSIRKLSLKAANDASLLFLLFLLAFLRSVFVRFMRTTWKEQRKTLKECAVYDVRDVRDVSAFYRSGMRKRLQFRWRMMNVRNTTMKWNWKSKFTVNRKNEKSKKQKTKNKIEASVDIVDLVLGLCVFINGCIAIFVQFQCNWCYC